ncbi:MAG: hypothetical protein OHK0039_09010 [Bacteroidia bacterium]
MPDTTFLHIRIPAMLAILLLAACQTAPQQQAEPARAYPDRAALQQYYESVAAFPIGDSALFPYVYQASGPTHIFSAYSMRFALTYDEPLSPRLNNQIPWVNPENYNPNNGFFINYVRNGRELRLEHPYIQVQYLSKRLPSVSSIDSVYIWLDGVFLANPEAEQLRARFEVPTHSGSPVAQCKEYKSANPAARQTKYLAYAYIDYNDEYLIGMALTTTNPEDFSQNKPLFYDLVRSFTPL